MCIDFTFQDSLGGAKKNRLYYIIVIIQFFFRRRADYVLPMFRLCQYLKTKKGIFFDLARILTMHRYSTLSESYNVSLPVDTKIGKGLCFPHKFPLVINPSAVIGRNCIIHPCVLIARDRGKRGAPIIGDNCYIGHGAKIIGNPKIEDWCFICPGAIVTKNIAEGTLIGSGLNNILSMKGKDHVLMYQK